MPYAITSKCVGTKDASCVTVCPVDCIHPTPDEPGYNEAEQLYIDPDSCIDCDACMQQCPVEAIYEADRIPAELAGALAINAAFFE